MMFQDDMVTRATTWKSGGLLLNFACGRSLSARSRSAFASGTPVAKIGKAVIVHQPSGNHFPDGRWSPNVPEITMQQSSSMKDHVVGFNPRGVDMQHLHEVFERVHDVVVARIVIAQFDANPRLKDAFPGVHLKALETIKRAQIRYAKAHRAGVRVAAVTRACRGIARWLASGVRACIASLRAVHRRRRFVASVRAEVRVPRVAHSADSQAEACHLRRVA